MLLFEPRTIENGSAVPGPENRPAGVSDTLAALLFARGARDAASMEAFLDPLNRELFDPFLLHDMDHAVARIRAAVEGGERIAVYGDYDADGVCAASLLTLALEELGAPVSCHIPNRHAEGYGMNAEAVKKLAGEGVKLIVTVDNGVKALEETALAASLGMDVIVTDHHRCGDELPACTALVCTAIPESLCPNADLCGAGIAYKLAEALLGKEAAEKYLVLAGVATVADVVPLLGENRAIVARALAALKKGEAPLGLKALLSVANAKRIDARTLAFLVAPRLNAAGRLADASLSVELLTCKDEARAKELAAELDALNARRKKEELGILAEASEMTERMDLTNQRGVVLKSEAWNSGVVGIAAARIAEKYYRPALLFSERDGVLTGSARSIPGVDLHEALRRCEGHFIRFGGHAYAAGVTMRAEEFGSFAAAFEHALQETARDELFLPRKTYELALPLAEVNLRLAADVERLEPFGEGNPEPLFCSQNLRLAQAKRIGDGSHLGLRAEEGGAFADAVGFSMGERLSVALDADRVDLLFTPRADAYFGKSTVKLYLSELRPAPVSDAQAFLASRGEKFIDAFSRNVLYNDSCGFQATAVSDAVSTAAALAGESFAGVLAVCFTQSGAERFLHKARQAGVLERFDLSFYDVPKGACAYHTLLLAPKLAQLDLSRYTSVVVCDHPVTEGALARLAQLAPRARFYAEPGDEADARPIREAIRIDRDFMARVFRAFKAADRAYYNREAALDALEAATGGKRYLCALALDVMGELGFIEANKKGNLALAAQMTARELIQSETFRAVAALHEDEQKPSI